jgi:hypothetical protein
MFKTIVKKVGLAFFWSSMAVLMVAAGLLGAWVGIMASG